MTVMLVGMPIVFLLLFVYVFGGTLGAGLGGASGGRADYVDYVTPGIILMTIAAAVQGTAISVAMDMTEGIIDRFRTMAIARVSVLTGHVLGSHDPDDAQHRGRHRRRAARSASGPTAGPGRVARRDRRPRDDRASRSSGCRSRSAWSAKTVETASNLPMPLILLPFLGSGFVPTDSMPAGAALVRRVPAVHPDHRDPARAADWAPDRQQRGHRRRLVRRHHPRRLPLVEEAVQPRPDALRRAAAPASAAHAGAVIPIGLTVIVPVLKKPSPPSCTSAPLIASVAPV